MRSVLHEDYSTGEQEDLGRGDKLVKGQFPYWVWARRSRGHWPHSAGLLSSCTSEAGLRVVGSRNRGSKRCPKIEFQEKMRSCMWGIRSRDGVVGPEYSDDELRLQRVKFEMLAEPLSGQKWGQGTRAWEIRDGR